MEKRLLVAALLSLAVLFLWQIVFPPPKRAVAPASPATAAAPAIPAAISTPAGAVPASVGLSSSSAPATPVAVSPDVAARKVEAPSEETVRVENRLVRLVLSNRGGRIASLELAGYTTDAGSPLDLVSPEGAAPLALEFPDREATAFAATALYRVDRPDAGWVRFEAARGALRIVRSYRLREDGSVEFSVETEGATPLLTLGPGARPIPEKELETRFTEADHGLLVRRGGEIDRTREKKVEGPVEIPAGAEFVALDDAYFVVALAGMPKSTYRAEAVTLAEGKKGPRRELRVLASTPESSASGRLIFAPKELERLRAYGVGLEKTINLGYFETLAKGLLIALRWFYGFTRNWGLAIILLTVAVRAVLFGFTWKSALTMKRMQALSPQVEEIKERYRKKKADPESRQKMNQEVMEVYQKAGVNPAAGCLPMILQLPIFFALFGLLGHAIELRHASFLWLPDLSIRDPYYIMPILMGAAWFIQTLVTPSTADPVQRKIFLAMPIVFTATMMNFASGLTLYWAVSNSLSILQQWLINRKS